MMFEPPESVAISRVKVDVVVPTVVLECLAYVAWLCSIVAHHATNLPHIVIQKHATEVVWCAVFLVHEL